MLYFVQNFNAYSPKNLACKELLDFVQKFERVLIKDELSLDAMVEEIRLNIQKISAKYPKLKKKINFSSNHISDGTLRIDATIESMGCPCYIFYIDICKVRRVFQFSEQVVASPKEIATFGVCRECGCTEDDPCFNPNVGTCWWADDEHTLCSHCADPRIKNDPETEHCINSKKKECYE